MRREKKEEECSFGLLVSEVKGSTIEAEFKLEGVTLMNNTSSEKNMPSDFRFMSYNYNTGKILYINTLDLIDIFYDSKRPIDIISSTSMLTCGQIGIKKKMFT